jgi:hypothetical protein
MGRDLHHAAGVLTPLCGSGLDRARFRSVLPARLCLSVPAERLLYALPELPEALCKSYAVKLRRAEVQARRALEMALGTGRRFGGGDLIY